MALRGFEQLRTLAQQEALTWKPIDSSLLQKLLRRLPNKAAGPDGISYDMLRHLPYPAVARLASLLTEMEREALLPIQMRYTNIVLIPKSSKVERPIALTSCLYRVWNSYRKHDIHKWQMTLDDALPWDQSRPHRDCLSIAVGRMLKAEIRKHQGIHTVTCLADLSCFYDTVNLDHIIEPAADLNYPPVHLKLALDLYRGPRLIQAEGIAGNPTHYAKGILQGCPQAPAISKLILYRPLQALQREHPAVALQTWVDDVSYDICGSDPDYVAREAVLAYRTLREHLTQAGLKVNTDKTGFISSSKETAKALQILLTDQDPQHYNVLRDLGVDATAGRHRRVAQVKKRFLKGRGRAGILFRLKLQRNIRYRLHKSAIHPVMSWGAQANGLAPQRRQYIRVTAARSLQLQRSGSVDIVYDMNQQHPDPGDSIIEQHLHSVWKIFHSFDESTQHLFWTSWNVALGALQKVRYRWQVVNGPLQALQAYLLDYDFDLSDGHECWPTLQFKLRAEFRWQRLLRITRYEGCHDLERLLDWQVSLTLQKMSGDTLGPGLRALHQGTLHGQDGRCPLCGEELTFIHLLWQCSFWKGKAKDLPEQWKERLAAGTEPELWQRGLVQSIFYLQDGGLSTFQLDGLWTPDEAFDIPTGHAVSLAVAPTCKDVRHKRYVFVICLHHVFTRKLTATFKGICPGQAIRSRAVFYALKHLALHSKEKVTVAIYDHAVWRAWQMSRACECFPDLFEGLEPDDFTQVRPLLFGKKELDPNAARHFFQQDAEKEAKKFAKASRNEDILDLQKSIDEDTRDILCVAAGRMNTLLRDKSHFLHKADQQEKHQKVPLIAQKKELLQQLLHRPDAGGHSWRPFRSGAQCSQCKQRLHSKSLVGDLTGALDSTCLMATPKTPTRRTRFEVANDLIAAQSGVQRGVHHLRLEKAYLRCSECHDYILARCREEAFCTFVGAPCKVGPLEPSMWEGHPSHTMERRGKVATCTRCGGKAKIVEEKLEPTERLRKRCEAQQSKDLRAWFT